MRLDHQIHVPLDVDPVWRALNDPQRVAPCLPGATLTAVDGDRFSATVKVKIGPISMVYAGSAEFVLRDDASYGLTLTASGREKNGAGRASATVRVELDGAEGTTTGTITTDLTITGRAAQFGRGMITEVGSRILDEFSSNLTAALSVPPEPGEAADDQPDALNLLDYAARSPIKRWLARVIALLAYPVVRLIGFARRKES